MDNVQSVKQKRTNSNTNYRRKMEPVPIIMDYCLLQFDSLKFFLGFRLHGGSEPNFNFFNVTPQIFQRNRKAHLFHNIFYINLRVIRRKN